MCWLLYCRFFDCFSVICNETFLQSIHSVFTHTPHHTKSALGSRGRDRPLVYITLQPAGMEVSHEAQSYFQPVAVKPQTVNTKVASDVVDQELNVTMN